MKTSLLKIKKKMVNISKLQNDQCLPFAYKQADQRIVNGAGLGEYSRNEGFFSIKHLRATKHRYQCAHTIWRPTENEEDYTDPHHHYCLPCLRPVHYHREVDVMDLFGPLEDLDKTGDGHSHGNSEGQYDKHYQVRAPCDGIFPPIWSADRTARFKGKRTPSEHGGKHYNNSTKPGICQHLNDLVIFPGLLLGTNHFQSNSSIFQLTMDFVDGQCHCEECRNKADTSQEA